MISSVVLSLKKDNLQEKQLRQVKKLMIMDTINDTMLCKKFKELCKQERSEENFALLDKINTYKKLCERSFEIQVYLYDTDVLSDQTNENSSSDEKKRKRKTYSEKDLHDIEKKKYEIALDVYTDFLDVRGNHSVNISKQLADNVKQCLDFFAKGENNHIPENLFDNIESEMCVLMMDTHHRFKLFIENQLREKKQIISTSNLKNIVINDK